MVLRLLPKEEDKPSFKGFKPRVYVVHHTIPCIKLWLANYIIGSMLNGRVLTLCKWARWKMILSRLQTIEIWVLILLILVDTVENLMLLGKRRHNASSAG